MKNRSFVKTSVKHRAKKLDVVLRRLTGDTLTKDQRLCLQHALDCRRQYRLRLCRTGCDFKKAVSPGQANKDCGKRVRMLLGKNCGMMAALVSSKTQGRGDNTVYLYLPESKEAMGDEMQEEDAKEA
ncbi:hypothetical protein AAAT94_03520 [Intestinimonas aquisgranensis]|uniref:hypothetical protein n=1 Tax=Pseudoflavonifractor TaxID=1017280 RepID=UPI001123D0CC|nr:MULTISPECIES: hypothetical protein [Oscillospiraceae]MCC2258485.1 hypothetical protein [Intestinimonas aquisgranensis]